MSSQYGQRVCIFWKFLQFLLYNYGNFMSKNLCDKVSKIEKLRWLLRRNFRRLYPSVLHFFCGHCFHGKFCKTLLKNLKTATIWQRNYPPTPLREPSHFFSLSPFSSPNQEDRFETINFNRGPRISFISILTFHEKVNRLKQLVIRFVQKLTV